MRKSQLIIALAAIGFAGSAMATNGMNLEGYGPVALGMGGASMAYDNGTAAVMNNPATLGLMGQGSRLDLAVGMLGPDVTSRCTAGPCAGAAASSGGDAYYMPAVGYMKKQNNLTYGVALFAQGGMGTEYSATSFMAGGNNVPTRSEVGVGRLIAPLAYNVNDNFTIGGSLDYVWAMMDIQMVATAGQVLAMSGMNIALMPGAPDSAYLSFSDKSDYTGKAKGAGFAAKLGFTYKINPTLTIGATYHSKTDMGDLETSSNGASFGLYAAGAALGAPDIGKITVRDFQWPETYGMGLAWQANPKLLVAADIKHIGWEDVMSNFRMTYSSAGFGTVNMTMPQQWKDQTVYALGISYAMTDAITLRVGANLSDNPVPNSTLNPLFPAIVKNHYTLGVGYKFDPSSDVNFALSYAPEVTVANVAGGVTSDHGQLSWQLMYSKRF